MKNKQTNRKIRRRILSCHLLQCKLQGFALITCLLLCAGGMRAAENYGQSTLLTLNAQNRTMQEVLDEIERQSEFHFFYNNRRIDMARVVTIKSEGRNIFYVLDRLFADMDIQYKVLDKNIILSPKELSVKTVVQDDRRKVVTGVVMDASNTPIIGANIIEKGTATNGTVTDHDGRFALSVSNHASLIVSYIGYHTQELDTRNKTSFTVVLIEDTKSLSEVVVTALGIKREEKALGYSVQKIGGEALSAVKGTDVASSLTGKIAGLAIHNSSEISEKPKLMLRGENPLIVVDGVAYGNITLHDLSAEDIESIDVLKGATASALYGVRGRAGAIMVTTKKSGESGILTVNISNHTMAGMGYLKIPKAQTSYSTGNYGQLEYNSGYVWGNYMDGREVKQYDPLTMEQQMMPLLPRGKNNISNFFRSGIITNTNVSISQAGKLGGFRISGTQVHERGSYPNTSLNKYILTGNGNITYNNFKIDASFSYKKEKVPNMPRVNYGNGNIFYNMLIWSGTEYDVFDYKNYWKVKDRKQNWPFEAWYDNPYYIMNERIHQQDKNLFTTNVTLSYDFMKNLSVIFRSGFDNYNNDEDYRQSIGDSGQKRGYYRYEQHDGSSFNNDLIVKGDYSHNDFGIDLIAGLSSYWYKTVSFTSNTRGGLSVPGFYSLNASVERPNVSKEISEKALYSIYGKAGLSWKSTIYLDITGRNDWSSTLPSSSRSYFYPSVSGSMIPTALWNPVEDILDFWKIRASWTVAKRDLEVYELNRIYSVETDVWNGLSTATYPTTLRDPNIKPETESSFEFGTDFRFFNNRLGFDYTLFNRLRYDRLISSKISTGSGFGQITTNTAEEIRQRGMEFTLRGKPVVNRDFTWEGALNAAFFHWYYDKLDPVYSSKDPRIKEGERYDKFFYYDWERDHEGNIVHQAGLPVKNKYQSVIGNSDPDLILGLSSSFRYKDFNLSISLDGRLGGMMYSWTEQALWHAGSHPDSDNQWRYDEVVNGKQNYVAPGSKVVNGSASYDAYGRMLQDTRTFAPNDIPVSYQSYTMVYNENPWDHQPRQNILDASFVKLREVALNYSFPAPLADKLLMKNVQIGIIGQNLLMWSKAFKYSDPDRGKENLNSPTTRYIGFNIHLTL